jgi:hypothetical protein
LPLFQVTGASGSGAEDTIEQMQEFNEWLKVNGPTTSPTMALLDTSDNDPSKTVSAVAAWVRTRLLTRNLVEWPNR